MSMRISREVHGAPAGQHINVAFHVVGNLICNVSMLENGYIKLTSLKFQAAL